MAAAGPLGALISYTIVGEWTHTIVNAGMYMTDQTKDERTAT